MGGRRRGDCGELSKLIKKTFHTVDDKVMRIALCHRCRHDDEPEKFMERNRECEVEEMKPF